MPRRKLILKMDTHVCLEDGEEVDEVRFLVDEDNLIDFLKFNSSKVILKALKIFKKQVNDIERQLDIEEAVQDILKPSDN